MWEALLRWEGTARMLLQLWLLVALPGRPLLALGDSWASFNKSRRDWTALIKRIFTCDWNMYKHFIMMGQTDILYRCGTFPHHTMHNTTPHHNATPFGSFTPIFNPITHGYMSFKSMMISLCITLFFLPQSIQKWIHWVSTWMNEVFKYAIKWGIVCTELKADSFVLSLDIYLSRYFSSYLKPKYHTLNISNIFIPDIIIIMYTCYNLSIIVIPE